jgi:hypothetical protein
MRGFWEARVEDLGPADLVRVECLGCGHVEMLTAAMLRTGGVADLEQVRNLPRRLRCRECDAKGRADVSIRWADNGAG